ncbi:MAG: M15 family metallopeptidase [Alphaproteobacteria bacterium]|nr:M15 family metallopeptidase [Alphaproteobacteria bacterium]
MYRKLYLFALLNLLGAGAAAKDFRDHEHNQSTRTKYQSPASSKLHAFYNLGHEHHFYKNVQVPGDTLSRFFRPDSLMRIRGSQFLIADKIMYIHANVIQALNEMGMAMYTEIGRPLIVISGYRSYYEQTIIYGDGGRAHSRAAPGTSQHQLGYGLDFIEISARARMRPEIQWLEHNVWRFGFVVSYTRESESQTGIMPEPWHYLYVGRQTAAFIQEYFGGHQYLFLNYLKLIRQNSY